MKWSKTLIPSGDEESSSSSQEGESEQRADQSAFVLEPRDSGPVDFEECRVLPDEPVVIGRHGDCDFQVSHPKVSRRHCRVEHAGEFLRIVDLDSSNGTFINDSRLDPEGKLYPDSILELGPVQFVSRFIPAEEDEGEEEEVEWSEDDKTNTVFRSKVDTADPWSLSEASEVELEDLKRTYQHFGAAYKISRMLAKPGDMEELLSGVLDTIFDSIEADRAAVFLFPDFGATAESNDPDQLSMVAAKERGENRDEGLSNISVSHTVISDVLENGVSTLCEDASSDERFSGAQSIVSQDIRSVVCSPVTNEQETLGVLYADSSSEVNAFNKGEVELLALIGNQAGLALHRARVMEKFEQFFLDTIRTIVATIDAKDGYTHHHSERVAAFSRGIAREAGIENEQMLRKIRLAGLLHDIGKIGVPDAILNKPGSLTDEEYEEVKKHTVYGEQILSNIKNPRFEEILPGVRSHHEQWDGSGYPDGLEGKDIPLLGRVLAVGDVLDALTSERAYRDAMPLEKAIKIIKEDAGSHFDPTFAKAAITLYNRGELEVSRKKVEQRLKDSELSDPSAAVEAISNASEGNMDSMSGDTQADLDELETTDMLDVD